MLKQPTIPPQTKASLRVVETADKFELEQLKKGKKTWKWQKIISPPILLDPLDRKASILD